MWPRSKLKINICLDRAKNRDPSRRVDRTPACDRHIEVIASIALVVSMVDSSISSHLLFFKNSLSDATYVYKVHTHVYTYNKMLW